MVTRSCPSCAALYAITDSYYQLTTQQARDKSKTVTRRLGWANLKPGERVQQVEKGQGLKKGQHPVKIHVIECVSNRAESLCSLAHSPCGKAECVKEGFPKMEPSDFVQMFCEHNGCLPTQTVQRIEFKYVEPIAPPEKEGEE
jgi:hypothetical protein